jgi:uncharacterized protein
VAPFNLGQQTDRSHDATLRAVRRLSLAAVILAAAACATPAPEQPQASATGFFTNGDVRLSYQLDTPAGRPPFPAVVIGHGSGETTKEMCRPLSARFLERGFATFCYDKRGVGQSTGTYLNIGLKGSEERFALLASDMAAAVTFLRAQRHIENARIGLMGPSQAGWIIPLAAELASPAFMILLAGPTVSVGEEIYYSKFAENTTTPVAELSAILAKYTGPRGFDPRPVLDRLSVPGLWLLGAADRSIPTKETVEILDDLSKRGRPYSRVVYPDAGHDLRAPFWNDIDRWLKKLRR